MVPWSPRGPVVADRRGGPRPLRKPKCLECANADGNLQPLIAQPMSLIIFVKILIDYCVANATINIAASTPAWRTQVSGAFIEAIKSSLPKTCRMCRRSLAFGVLWYTFGQAKVALSWMPLRTQVRTFALDNLAVLRETCYETCPIG
jgi:hypothetical protein